MNKNPNQPGEFDAVKGGEAPLSIEGVVLGGLEGVKHRHVFKDMIQRLSDLNCRVITQPQYNDSYRYIALYE